MKVLDSIWYSSLKFPIIGVVLCFDEITCKFQAYIGTGDGIDQGADAEEIRINGAKISFNVAVDHFPRKAKSVRDGKTFRMYDLSDPTNYKAA